MLPRTIALVAVTLLAAPAAAFGPALPGVDDTLLGEGGPRLLSVHDVHAAWSIDLGLSVGAGQGVSTPGHKAKSVCGLGDVDGDGNDDILVRLTGKVEDQQRFQALAGPDFTRVLWTATPSDKRLLTCGADLTGDGVSDPITVTGPEPSAPEPADAQVPDTPVTTGEATTTTSIPLDGAQGEELAQIPVESTVDSVAAGPAGAASSETGQVVPAGDGALLVIGATDASASSSVPNDVSVTQSQAAIQVVDETGAILGTIETPPASDAVAAAPAPAGEGALPDIVVLTEVVAVPVDSVPVGVPTVTLYEGDGSEQWAIQQEPTAGVPILLPDAGDVDGDGVADLIYATIPADAATVASGGYEVLSGADGSTITDSGAAQDGLVTALPFGDADGKDGDEILVIEQASDDAELTLSAERADGTVVWATEADAEATPANTLADEESGNTIGFSDLTGDGVPDVLVTVPSDSGTTVEVIDGATGTVVWQDEFEGADAVTTVPGDDGAGDDLLIVDTDGGLTVTSVQGGSGQTSWQASGTGASSAAVDVTLVGDVDGDGVEDILVSIGAADSEGAVEPDAPGSSYIVSGDSGTPLWSGPTGDGSTVDLQNSGSFEQEAEPSTAKVGLLLPVTGALVLLAALAVLVLFMRRRGTQPL